MRLFRKKPKGPLEVQTAPDPENVNLFDRSPITYVVVRVGDHWCTTFCADRTEAMSVVDGLEKDGWYAFAGEATYRPIVRFCLGVLFAAITLALLAAVLHGLECLKEMAAGNRGDLFRW